MNDNNIEKGIRNNIQSINESINQIMSNNPNVLIVHKLKKRAFEINDLIDKVMSGYFD